MEYEVLEGPAAGSWARCSITGLGDAPDTYNIYVWGAPPSQRHVYNIPLELLRTQAEQDAKRKAVEDAERRAVEQQAAKRWAQEEAERQAKEELERQRQAAEEAMRRAREEAEVQRKAEEEVMRKAAEAEAQLKASRLAQQRAEEEARQARERAEQEAREWEEEARQKAEKEQKEAQRKAKLKARWAEVKAKKRKAEEDYASKKLEEVREAKRQKAEQDTLRAMSELNAATVESPVPEPAPLEEPPEDIWVVVRTEGGLEASVKLKRTVRLRVMMDAACKKLGMKAAEVRFTSGKKVLSPMETAGVFGRGHQVVILAERIENPEDEEAEAMGHFEAGDFLAVKLGDDLKDTLPCSIARKGSSPGLYDIHCAFAPNGQQDVADVPARRLQKVKAGTYALAVKRLRMDPPEARLVMRQLAREVEQPSKGRTPAIPAYLQRKGHKERKEPRDRKEQKERKEREEPEPPHQLPLAVPLVGDFAELGIEPRWAKEAGLPPRLPCRIEALGTVPETFDVRLDFAPAGREGLQGVAATRLRRMSAPAHADAVRRLKHDLAAAQAALTEAVREVEEDHTLERAAEEEGLS